MPRPHFSIKTLLWLMAVVAVALASFSAGRRFERRELERKWAALDSRVPDLRSPPGIESPAE